MVVADTGNHELCRIDAQGWVKRLAGSATQIGRIDGPLGQARFDSPDALLVGADGELYISDSGNDSVRKLSADSVTAVTARRERD